MSSLMIRVNSGNGTFTYSLNDYIIFNSLVFSYPNSSSYNTTNSTYIVPVSGIYQFSYRLFVSSTPSTSSKIGLLKNGVTIAITGNVSANIESLTTLESCNVGDIIRVRCLFGTGLSFWMNPEHCSFSGELIYEIS